MQSYGLDTTQTHILSSGGKRHPAKWGFSWLGCLYKLQLRAYEISHNLQKLSSFAKLGGDIHFETIYFGWSSFRSSLRRLFLDLDTKVSWIPCIFVELIVHRGLLWHERLEVVV